MITWTLREMHQSPESKQTQILASQFGVLLLKFFPLLCKVLGGFATITLRKIFGGFPQTLDP